MSRNTVPHSRSGPLDGHIESFVAGLTASGYRQLRDRRGIAADFVRWTKTLPIAVTDLSDAHVAEYLESLKAAGPYSKKRFQTKRAMVRRFLCHLREEGVVPNAPVSTKDTSFSRVERAYEEYLRDERGLSFRSLRVYLPPARAFLTDRREKVGDISLRDIDAEFVRVFLLSRIHDRSREYARLQTVSLRSFLRFLFYRGETLLDLSFSIPAFHKPRRAPVHAHLSPAEVERVLSSVDRTTPVGRRDGAILHLLARLGLRAGEVVLLELDDISWRTGEFIVRGKGRVRDRLPLLNDVGLALALYIKSDRGESQSRRVFVRRVAPRVGLTCPSVVGNIVRRAVARAGLPPPPRGVAAHLLRYSMGTQMIRRGATIPEISEILRHRCSTTTEIYTKVAFESLREVARPWPTAITESRR